MFVWAVPALWALAVALFVCAATLASSDVLVTGGGASALVLLVLYPWVTRLPEPEDL